MDYNRKRIIHYESRAAIDLSEEEIKACADLFSTSYGMYDKTSPFHPGCHLYVQNT